jgi:sec-independent protein translocase protein TatC
MGFGIAFELPLVVFYLTVFNIVPYKKLRASWRVVYIVLMVVCAMVTPDANPVTMIMMFAAMAVLYEGSLFLSRIVLVRRLAREKREGADGDDAADGDADEDDD